MSPILIESTQCSKIAIDALRKYANEQKRATPERVLPNFMTFEVFCQNGDPYFKKQ